MAKHSNRQQIGQSIIKTQHSIVQLSSPVPASQLSLSLTLTSTCQSCNSISLSSAFPFEKSASYSPLKCGLKSYVVVLWCFHDYYIYIYPNLHFFVFPHLLSLQQNETTSIQRLPKHRDHVVPAWPMPWIHWRDVFDSTWQQVSPWVLHASKIEICGNNFKTFVISMHRKHQVSANRTSMPFCSAHWLIG